MGDTGTASAEATRFARIVLPAPPTTTLKRTMKSSAKIVHILPCILLVACSSGTGEPANKAAEQNKELLNSVQKPLEKAGQVEKQLLDAAEAERKKIDELSQ
jgi:pyrroline-5-carboxylate reductase